MPSINISANQHRVITWSFNRIGRDNHGAIISDDLEAIKGQSFDDPGTITGQSLVSHDTITGHSLLGTITRPSSDGLVPISDHHLMIWERSWSHLSSKHCSGDQRLHTVARHLPQILCLTNKGYVCSIRWYRDHLGTVIGWPWGDQDQVSLSQFIVHT